MKANVFLFNQFIRRRCLLICLGSFLITSSPLTAGLTTYIDVESSTQDKRTNQATWGNETGQNSCTGRNININNEVVTRPNGCLVTTTVGGFQQLRAIDGTLIPEWDLKDGPFKFLNNVEGYADPVKKIGTEYRLGSMGLVFKVKANTLTKERSELLVQGSSNFNIGNLEPGASGITGSSIIRWRDRGHTGFSFKLPSNYSDGQEHYISQFYQRAPDGPPASITLGNYNNKGVQLKMRTQYGSDSSSGTTVRLGQVKIPKGQWIDVVISHRFDPDNTTGYFRPYYKKNSDSDYIAPAPNYTPSNNPTNISFGQSFKNYSGKVGFTGAGSGIIHTVGIYRPITNGKSYTTYIDEIRNWNGSSGFGDTRPDRYLKNEKYPLKNRGSSVATGANRCIDKYTVGTEERLKLVNCSGNNNNHKWKFQHMGSSRYYRLQNAGNSKCIGINGDRLRLVNCGTSNWQQWELINQGSGNYKVKNRGGGTCAGIGSSGSTQYLRLSGCSGTSSYLKWFF